MDRLHHVAIFTADYAATAAFYREVFGAAASAQCTQPSAITFGDGGMVEVLVPEEGRADLPFAVTPH